MKREINALYFMNLIPVFAIWLIRLTIRKYGGGGVSFFIKNISFLFDNISFLFESMPYSTACHSYSTVCHSSLFERMSFLIENMWLKGYSILKTWIAFFTCIIIFENMRFWCDSLVIYICKRNNNYIIIWNIQWFIFKTWNIYGSLLFIWVFLKKKGFKLCHITQDVNIE